MLQGNLIDIEKSGLQEQFPGFLYALIISHSCDIAARSELEPCIELLPCHPIESIDGNKTKAKKPKRTAFFDFRRLRDFAIRCICKRKVHNRQKP